MNFLPDVYVPCEVCHGARYNRETLEVHFKGKTIAEVLDMPIEDGLPSSSRRSRAIARHLRTLVDVGLGYVRLGQPAPTLSGGEAQRVKLASELQKRSTGRTVYVLDEPTTGLHFEDIRKLLGVLQARSSTRATRVLVIEHNLDVIKTADWVIDMGPEGGSGGGTVVAEGTPEQVAAVQGSHTGAFLAPLLGTTPGSLRDGPRTSDRQEAPPRRPSRCRRGAHQPPPASGRGSLGGGVTAESEAWYLEMEHRRARDRHPPTGAADGQVLVGGVAVAAAGCGFVGAGTRSGCRPHRPADARTGLGRTRRRRGPSTPPTQVVVTQPSEGVFTGFSAICTHQGCLVTSVADGVIDCPCHGSAFSISDGAVLSGPAPPPCHRPRSPSPEPTASSEPDHRRDRVRSRC